MDTGKTKGTGLAAGFFEATRWSTIIDGGHSNDTEVKRAALERLFARYHRPIFCHIQASLPPSRRGEAEDLTQAFILQALRLDFLKNVSPDRGRFRTFIKRCIHNFLCDEHDRNTAIKQGGGQTLASLDETDGEGNRVNDPSAPVIPPGIALDREWALSVLENSLSRLEQECVSARQGELFKALKGHLGHAPEDRTAKEIGERLGMKEGTVHVALNRMRGRLGNIIQEEIKQTVGTEEDWREELRYLVDLLGR